MRASARLLAVSLILLASTALAQTGSIEGTVVGRATSAPIARANGYLEQSNDSVNVTAGTTTSGIGFALDLGATITGRVTDAATGAPLAGVSVLIFYPAGGNERVYTDANGSYAVGGLPTGTYHAATTESGGYVDKVWNDIVCFPSLTCDINAATPISVTQGVTISGIDFALVFGGRIEGAIVDDAIGGPLAGMHLNIYNGTATMSVADTYTDENGRYGVGGLITGPYLVATTNHSGAYVDELYDDVACLPWCDFSRGTPVSVTVGQATTGIDFRLGTGGRIEGTVRDPNGGPLEAVTVKAYTRAGSIASVAWSDANGHYSITRLTAGTYTVATVDSRYLNVLWNGFPCTNGCTVQSGTPVTLLANGLATGIDFTLRVAGRISGHVRSAADGQPIAGVLVDVFQTSPMRWLANSSTDADGAYTVSPIPTGSFAVFTRNFADFVDQLYTNVTCPFFNCDPSAAALVGVTEGSTTGGIDFALRPGGHVAGRMTDAISGVPIVGRAVGIYDTAGALIANPMADNAGNYRSTGIPPGTYFVRTSAGADWVDRLYANIACAPINCATTSGTPVVVTAGNTTGGIDFALAQNGIISGRVTDGFTAAPLAGVTIGINLSTGQPIVNVTTDANGNYAATVAPAMYTVRVIIAPGYNLQTEPRNVTVASGGRVTGIDFALLQPARVAGRVMDGSTGAPLAGVTVWLLDVTGASLIGQNSDANGNYVLTPASAGTYYVRTATTLSYLDQLYRGINCYPCPTLSGTAVTATLGQTTTGIDFALAPGGRIAGSVVTEGFAAAPLAGVTVSIYSTSGVQVTSAVTDANGQYRTILLPTGTYYARTMNSLGYTDELYDNISCGACPPLSGTPIVVTAGGTAYAYFGLSNFARVSGRVTDASTGAPLTGVTVSLYSSTGSFVAGANSDGSGNYTVSLQQPGIYFAGTSNPLGYVNKLYNGIACAPSCAVTSGTPIAATLGATTGNIDFALGLGGRIAGRVTDAGTGAPLAGVTVWLYTLVGTYASAVTDANGNYTTHDGVPAGAYYAQTYNARGYLEKVYDNVLCVSGCSTATIGTPIVVSAGNVTGGIDFALIRGGKISGRVTNAATGTPLAGVIVFFYPSNDVWAQSVTTDANGNYSGGVLIAGTYFVHTNASGYINEAYDDVVCSPCGSRVGNPVPVTSGNTTTGINFALATGGRISGHVINAATGAPLPSVTVKFYDNRGLYVGANLTDASGNYTSNALVAGTYYARTMNWLGYIDVLYRSVACTPCTVTNGTPVAVANGTTTSGIDFALSKGASISGRVRALAGGAPLPGVRVDVYSPSGGIVMTATSDATSGVYITGGLPSGTYFVRTSNTLGYIDQIYNGVACPLYCTVTNGTPVALTAPTSVFGLDFALDRGAQVSGRITSRATGAAIAGITVSLYAASGTVVSSAVTDASGNYATVDGVQTGTYYAGTANSSGYVNQIYQNVVCRSSCTPSTGLPLALVAGSTRSGIDFTLDMDADADGDGIASTIDRQQSDGADQSTSYSSDFNDTPIGGTTTGTVADRGGWNVTVKDVSPGGVQAQLAGNGASAAKFSVCSAGGAEGVVLDVAGEWADIVCSAAGSATVKALVATPVLQLRKPLSGAATVIDLSAGQSATLGSPVVADPGNTAPIVVRFVDDNDVTFGSLTLDPGESVEATVVTGGVVQVDAIAGVVEGSIDGQSVVLRAGETKVYGSPADALDALVARVNTFLASGDIRNSGIAQSMTASLENAKKQLGGKAAANELNALLNKLDAYLKGGQITQNAYDALVPAIKAVLNMIG